MSKEIIVVEQLPIIKQQLQTIKADVTQRVEQAMNLVCTEETVKEIKNIRAEFNKELTSWENKRKEVKKAIMTPYEQFEIVYKDCITDVFKKADTDLKTKIDSVENEIKKQKQTEVKEYFTEYLASKNIDFITYEHANINVTLSASKKSLKEQAKAFIDRVCDDLNLIDTQEHKDEILYEYKQSLNVSKAIKTVVDRYKAIEEQRAREEEKRAKAEAEQKAIEKVEQVVESLTPPTVVETEPIITVKFTVKGTRTQLKEIKNFIISKGVEIV